MTTPPWPPESRRVPWMSWALGAALLGVVIAAALHFSEESAFITIIQRARPGWIAVAIALQAGTYIAQGGVWRRVIHGAGSSLSRSAAYQLSLAKVFADQAIPSAGLSSSVLVARALNGLRLPGPAVKAVVLINIASYHLGYVATLIVALALLARRGQLNLFVFTTALLFLLFSVLMSGIVLALGGRAAIQLPAALGRLRAVRGLLDFVVGADRRLMRTNRLLIHTIGLQIVIVLLDAGTMWCLLRALGAQISVDRVFASFMIASLFRTMGILPGGLGTFEATSVLMLRLIGLDVATGLSATLLFRGLSFWFPMLPGYWCSQRSIQPAPLAHASRPLVAYWSLPAAALAQDLRSNIDGLSQSEADARLETFGPNELREGRSISRLNVLGSQLRSPLLLLLLFAAAASVISGEWLDAAIVLVIVTATVGIGYSREYSAQAAAAALRERLGAQTRVLRDRTPRPIRTESVVPGDIVLLAAGSLVPADAVILEATDFFVSEAVLTGESFPVQKFPGVISSEAGLAQRTNCVFMGTNVRSGTARCIVVHTGVDTEFGAIAHRLALRPPETEFDRGIRRFGYLLTSTMLIMVLLVFAVHVLSGRPPVDTLLFSVALAVGLSPELLPAILSVNLARGAQSMASRGVLVRRLNAIENLGSMNVLCTDKTGTLTEGVVQVEGSYDAQGRPSPQVLSLAACNAAFETGIESPLDDAITRACVEDMPQVEKLGEIPFDFIRKRITVAIADGDSARLIVKGAFHHVLEICVATCDGGPLDTAARDALAQRYEAWTARGVRVLAVATRTMDRRATYSRDDEREMTFAGFLTFLDRPKEGVAEAIKALATLGVSIKIITGDSRLVAQHVASLVGLSTDRVLTGQQLDDLHDEALWRVAEQTSLFVEVDPNQKERIILALKKMGHVVGFLGDGVNDAPAMHAADTSLSVDQAVDVAREAADFVLLRRGLDVIRYGIEEGRRTFANTLKYVLVTTSANLGNMLSMAAASLFLPFLPLTAGQILLNNFLSDIPAVGIAGDSVDPELVNHPRRWDMRFIGRYMVEFGTLSSLFDLVTFVILLVGFRASAAIFQTGWFVESLLTELVVALVMRTRRPFFRSRPGTLLLTLTLILIVVSLVIPYLPSASIFAFVPLPPVLLLTIVVIMLLYVAATELQKRWFYRTA